MYYNKIWGGEMYYVFNYGERLRQLRRERGFTQEEVALRADITTS